MKQSCCFLILLFVSLAKSQNSTTEEPQDLDDEFVFGPRLSITLNADSMTCAVVRSENYPQGPYAGSKAGKGPKIEFEGFSENVHVTISFKGDVFEIDGNPDTNCQGGDQLCVKRPGDSKLKICGSEIPDPIEFTGSPVPIDLSLKKKRNSAGGSGFLMEICAENA